MRMPFRSLCLLSLLSLCGASVVHAADHVVLATVPTAVVAPFAAVAVVPQYVVSQPIVTAQSVVVPQVVLPRIRTLALPRVAIRRTICR